MTGSDHAGVFVPPPLFYVTPLALAVMLQTIRPWTLAGGPAGFLLGGAVLAIGIAIGLASVQYFRRARTTILPMGRPTTAIVETGPYRFTRNPMYVAMTAAYLGLAFLLNTAWAVLVLPAVLVAIDRWVIRREERYLLAKFGEPYRDYCARVRRWL
jgi:protein-S-isoprenylcysteine O-methyltransferase Ste14